MKLPLQAVILQYFKAKPKENILTFLLISCCKYRNLILIEQRTMNIQHLCMNILGFRMIF